MTILKHFRDDFAVGGPHVLTEPVLATASTVVLKLVHFSLPEAKVRTYYLPFEINRKGG